MYLDMSHITFILLLISFFVGACFGSFINLAAYRIPRGFSIISPSSYCNDCKKKIPVLSLIPVFGYLLTGGKCKFCKAKIPLEYPLVEILCGLFFSFIFLMFFPLVRMAFYESGNFIFNQVFLFSITLLWLFVTGLLLSIIDFKHRILPNIITIPGIFVGFVLGSLNHRLGVVGSLAGILVGGGGLYLISFLYSMIRKREGMGLGDIKYLAFLGGITGIYGVFFTLFFASLLGSFVGIFYAIVKKTGLNLSIPFGPFLFVGSLIYMLGFVQY